MEIIHVQEAKMAFCKFKLNERVCPNQSVCSSSSSLACHHIVSSPLCYDVHLLESSYLHLGINEQLMTHTNIHGSIRLVPHCPSPQYSLTRRAVSRSLQ